MCVMLPAYNSFVSQLRRSLSVRARSTVVSTVGCTERSHVAGQPHCYNTIPYPIQHPTICVPYTLPHPTPTATPLWLGYVSSRQSWWRASVPGSAEWVGDVSMYAPLLLFYPNANSGSCPSGAGTVTFCANATPADARNELTCCTCS